MVSVNSVDGVVNHDDHSVEGLSNVLQADDGKGRRMSKTRD